MGEAEDPDTGADDYPNGKDLPIHYDPDKDEDLKAMEGEQGSSSDQVNEEEEGFETDILVSRKDELAALSTLKKFRLTQIKICSSPQRRQRFRKIAEEVYGDKLHILPDGKPGRKIATLMPIPDVKHRQYAQRSIQRGELLIKAQEKWLFERPELRPLILQPEQWELLRSLNGVLEVFTEVTLQMSKSSTPTLPWVLPMYELMLAHLKACRDDLNLPFELRTAATAGLLKLEQYHELAQKSQFNIISTVLHPALGWACCNDTSGSGGSQSNG
ncbi:hypothetical protein MIND_01115100 [Mycena indigotica]|uniref:Uncharacterized protein n=1 Tax=Mycena indigotica TaxID=2126181 RepID=A0A8H6S7V0_9AGAR|nr:uncharacterized protein MIND_01115100 [Mycena indigotica]KAF7293382.1 hypothetical protein MIND_01115100 [Mycena indigotica]